LPEILNEFWIWGDGRLVSVIKAKRPDIEAVALDMSPTMLDSARDHFAKDQRVTFIVHDLSQPPPDMGYFDAVVSICNTSSQTRTKTNAL
jgi:tRNA (cmo5U34)-methyltransferase